MTRDLPDDRPGLSRGSHFSSPGHVPGLQLQLKDGASGGLINHGVVPSENPEGGGIRDVGAGNAQETLCWTYHARAFLPEKLLFVFSAGVHDKSTVLHQRRKVRPTTSGCGGVYDVTLLIFLRRPIVSILPSALLAYIST